MAGIFPSPTGVQAADTDGGYEPALTPIGGPARFYGRECQTTLYYWALNSLVSEILAAVDRLGYAYNSGRVDNLGAALADVIGNMQLSLTAALSDIGDLQADQAATDAAVAALQGAVSTIQSDLNDLGDDIDAITLYLNTLDATQVKLNPPINGRTTVQQLLTDLFTSISPMPTDTVKGNILAGSNYPQNITMAQLTARLLLGDQTRQGLIPQSTGLATDVFRGNNTWGAGAVSHGDVYLRKSGANVSLRREGSGSLIVNGVQRLIPVAGLTLAATGAAATTSYLIYVWDDAGTLKLGREPVATGHTTDGVTGVEIITGHADWTLVGRARTAAAATWAADDGSNIPVLSWFNRKLVRCYRQLVANINFVNTALQVLSDFDLAVQCWGDELVRGTAQGGVTVTGVAAGYSILAVDGNFLPPARTGWSNNTTSSLCLVGSDYVAEGDHLLQLMCERAGGTNVLFLGTGTGRCTILCETRG